MDTYREPPLARSPVERTSWGERDEGVSNYRERGAARGDDFYRGRSPGTFCFIALTLLVLSLGDSSLLSRLPRICN